MDLCVTMEWGCLILGGWEWMGFSCQPWISQPQPWPWKIDGATIRMYKTITIWEYPPPKMVTFIKDISMYSCTLPLDVENALFGECFFQGKTRISTFTLVHQFIRSALG